MRKKATNTKSNRDENENTPFEKGNSKNKTPLVINYSLKMKCKNQKQKQLIDFILENRIVFVRGAAGTGKTIVSLFAALECLRDKKHNIGKIILSKPYIQSASNQANTGFLKGTLEDKILPHFSSFYSNLNKIIGAPTVNFLKVNCVIEDQLINFLRGETFGDYDSEGNPIGNIAILDEAQNTTQGEMMTFISRLGEFSKLIILGCSDQIDIKLARGEKNGLDDAFERFQDIPGIAFIEFTEDEIVRDKFLIEIMKRYKI
jgi:phosphate starvation-inducible PhoH-like protein